MADLPKRYQQFANEYPEVVAAYEKLGDSVHNIGSLDEKTRALIKLGISSAARCEGAVHSHTRKALELGISQDEIRQTILLALPTIGFPQTMAALSWVDDILEK